MMGAKENRKPVLTLRGITKVYPGVVALDNVDFVVYPNEVVGLIGENGAGKSTLMKILVGNVQPDGGEFKTEKDGTVVLSGPASAIKYGIGMVFQEGSLLPNLSVAENLVLCHEKIFEKYGFISRRNMKRIAREQLEQVKVRVMSTPLCTICLPPTGRWLR